MYALFFAILLLFMLLFVTHMTNNQLIESLTDEDETQNYSGNNPMILAQKNAGNILYLESRLKSLPLLEKNFAALQTDVTKNKEAIQQMSQIAVQHISHATGIPSTGTTLPPSIQKLSTISSSH